MKSKIINVTAPLHLIGAFVRGDKDVALPVDIVQTVGDSPIDVMSQQAVSKAISEGILFETYNRDEIDQKDRDILKLSEQYTNETVTEAGELTKEYIDTQDDKYLDEYRTYAHEQDLYFKDLTIKEAKDYADDIVTNIRLFSIKGRVDTIDDLPLEGNRAFDMYLVGPVGAKQYDEYYWLTTVTPNKWEIFGTMFNEALLENFYTKLEVDEKLTTTNGKVSALETGKVDKIPGKGLSTNDFTAENKTLLSSFTKQDIDEMLLVNSTEEARKANEIVRETNEAARKADTAEAIRETMEVAEHPTYIDSDYFVVKWDRINNVYVKTDINVRGPQGIQGVQGVQGEQGEQGIQGEKGGISYATFAINVETGMLEMYTDENYAGAKFALEDGKLTVTI